MDSGEIVFCEHVINEEQKPLATVLDKETGERRAMCRLCFPDFIRGLGYEPREYLLGFHLYRSSDPALPKKDWTRVTDEPASAKRPFREKKPDPNVDWYYYYTTINAYGVEGYPSQVIGPGDAWNIGLISDAEM